MTPNRPPNETDRQEDLFKTKLEDIIDRNHELARLADLIDWELLVWEYGSMYHESMGRPGHPTRLMAGLHYLKEAFGLSDEGLMLMWRENPYWQYFCGMKYFEHKAPMSPTSLGKWRRRIGPEKLERMLAVTVGTARKINLLKASSLKKLNVDTTVQEKAIRYPTDAKLYFDMREKLVAAARVSGLELRQSYVFLAKSALMDAFRYSHARQMKRARKNIKKLKTYLGRVVRDIQRKTHGDILLHAHFAPLLDLAARLLSQQRGDKNKLYSLHAPEAECISKGKAHKKYEFGVKAGIVTTSTEGIVLAIQAHHGNPYDGHTLAADLAQAERIIGKELAGSDIFVDRGYRGHDYEGSATIHIVAKIKKSFSKAVRKWMKRRAAIEPEIGHMKSDGALARNHLAGKLGDQLNAILCGCGHNIRKVLRHLRAQPHPVEG
jgi:transposase, IS5 family